MSQQCCLICASDEGIFLDIFSNGNNFRDNIETCLSLKTKKSDLPSTKICHKCAYELDQCSKFVKKYKKTQLENGKLYKKNGYCSLCMEPGRKGLIFDLINENPLNNPQEKIHRLFNIDGNFSNLSICLDCRYNLDVLFDLKCILSDHSDHLKKVLSGEIQSPNMEKIKTNVVRRKTTSVKTSPTKFIKDSLSDMDSDTSSISENTSTRLRSNGSSSVSHKRECEECRAKVPIGDDMFRYHTSGLTVCKQCCLKMDPSDSNRGKRRKISTETKFCCVFLKDILTSSDNKHSTIEKDENSDSIYTISDDSTIEETQPAPKKINTISKLKRKNNQNDSKLLKKPKNDVGLRKSSRTRASSVQNEQFERKSSRTRASSVQNEQFERKSLRSSRARSVDIVRVVGARQLPERKNSSSTKSETNKSKSLKKTNELSKLNLSSEKNKKNVSNVTNRSRKRTRNKSNSSISSIEENRLSKTNKKISKLSHPKADSDSDNSRPYTCNICHNDFDNRVEGLTHELTHSKSLEVVLKKVSITDNTDNKLNKNETEQHDEISDVINDVNDKEKVDALSSELSKESSVEKPCNKDDGNDIHNEIQTTDNTLEECENDKINSNREDVKKIIDEKNDDGSNNGNDENSKNNDSKQNNGSNNIKSNNENEEKTDENNDKNRDETEKDRNEQEDSLIVVDTCSNNGDINQENQEKDHTNDHNNATCTDNNVDNSICESEEKTNEDNEKTDEKSSEKNTETTFDVIRDDENSVNPKKSKEDKEKEEANNKIVLITNNIGENDNAKVNDNDDVSEKEEEKEKNEDEKEEEKDENEKEKEKKKDEDEKEKEKDEDEREKNEEEKEEEKNEEEKEVNKDQEEKEKDTNEEEHQTDKAEQEKESKKFEDNEESLQCSHDESTRDSLINRKNEASLHNQNNTVDDKNKDEEQLADKTVENDKNSNCDKKNEKKNITDDEDEGALIEKEMEKIKNHINNSKQVDQANVDLENNIELEEISNDSKSVSELNLTNSENREEP